MILDDDFKIIDNSLNVPITEDLLNQLHCTKLKESSRYSTWKIFYKGREKELDFGNFGSHNTVRVCIRYYCDKSKTSWYSFSSEYASTLKELYNWLDAELDFFKDHPEEDPTTEEYKERQEALQKLNEYYDSYRCCYTQDYYAKYNDKYNDYNDKYYTNQYKKPSSFMKKL